MHVFTSPDERPALSSHPDPAGNAESPRSTRHWREHLRLRHLWALIAVVIAVVGVLGSVFAANAVASADASKSAKSFDRSSQNIAAILQLAIQHQSDLVVNAGAYAAENPSSSQAEFVEWTTSAQVLERYPELQAIGVVTLVPAADLAAYATHALIDPSGPLDADGTFSVTPPGPRASYCLTSLSRVRTVSLSTPAGFDACAGSNGVTLLAARDTGVGTYQPYQLGSQTSLGIETPIYAGGTVPNTIAARRVAFAGWVGTLTDPSVLLRRALQGYPNTSVSLRYHVGSSDVSFASGHAQTGAHTFTTSLTEGWAVTTGGTVSGEGIFDDRTAIELLISGIVLSVLLGLFIFMLGTGRERARKLVGQRTGQLRHQALHDSLTGLPNRALIMDRIEQLLARSRRYATTGSALFLDLDDFKNVNDTLGHHAGDRLLVAVAARLAGTLRDADTIGRMGGDEFVILVDGGSDDVSPQLVAERLLDVMRQPFQLDDALMPLMVNISIGIASGNRASAGELLRDADVALYQAKAMGKNRYEIFNPAMQTKISRRTDLEFELRSALSGNQYRLMYQPIYQLDDLTVIGVEALLRWDHPTGDVVSPDEFIPILEQTGQIREVGRWVLRTACEQMAAWHSRGDTLNVSVNVSGRQLDHDSIITDIRDALDASGLPAASLIIEITETALMRNAEATALRLGTIKRLGVRIAVDDFGTGYSSLAYLRQFPVDCLKIDRAFTNAVTTSPESKALIKTLVQLGKDLGLTTLAEGVETTDEMDLLRGANVDQAQGFLMARPLDPDILEAQLLNPTRPVLAIDKRP
jgi:diguanylate cyclase (GGDEF)-like protein